tara:strand:- start:46928 stop:47257 length:330 start_codon:yes stop_codon:yes gene_type:complete
MKWDEDTMVLIERSGDPYFYCSESNFKMINNYLETINQGALETKNNYIEHYLWVKQESISTYKYKDLISTCLLFGLHPHTVPYDKFPNCLESIKGCGTIPDDMIIGEHE